MHFIYYQVLVSINFGLCLFLGGFSFTFGTNFFLFYISTWLQIMAVVKPVVIVNTIGFQKSDHEK